MLTSRTFEETCARLAAEPLDPLAAADALFSEAAAHEPEAGRAALASATPEGQPSVRFVLLKEITPAVVFYTSYESRKGRELLDNPRAAIAAHWWPLGAQIRFEGPVSTLDPARSDAYFASRSRGSQLGAWASEQSATIAGFEALDAAFEAASQRFEGQEVPRPERWGGFALTPLRVELWFNHASRLHRRFEYARASVDAPWARNLRAP